MVLRIVFVLIIILPIFGFGQLDSIQKLDEVVLSDYKLERYNESQKITALNDSVLQTQPSNFTNLLSFNTNIYFKENGFGMVSSPSFRGTNASQTAVLWNGININSQLTGQTDFGTLSTLNYDTILIKSGGGSVQNGSGAIGGTIHLNNSLAFNNPLKQTINLNYGSFNTKQTDYKIEASSRNIAVNAGLNYTESDNDYEYLGEEQKNENGQFRLYSFFANLGYAINKKHSINYYGNTFIGNRNLSGTLVAKSKNKYKDETKRNLIEWKYDANLLTSSTKLARINESYKYFENKDKPQNFSFGEVSQTILKNETDFKVSSTTHLFSILEYSNSIGKGSSFGNPERNTYSSTLIFKQDFKRFTYQLSGRKDFITDFSSPFLFSADVNYQFTKHYSAKLNGSKNYRIPTFNDLFYQPGGNINLTPETSYQADFGQELSFKSIQFLANVFYIKTQDMIQWTPNQNGIFSPKNINEVENIGAEFEISATKKIRSHYLKFDTKYSFTSARNLENNKQLIYVPKHKANANIAYNYKSFNLFYQQLYISSVNIIGSGFLPSYTVGNLGIAYTIYKTEKSAYQIQFKTNNIFNTYYENVALRPMPNRNYNLQLTLNL